MGPKFGKQLGEIRAALSDVDGNAAMDEVNETGALKLVLPSGEVVLEKDDLLIDIAQKEGYVSESDNKITVVLDTNLTPELLEEGFVKEIISKVQTMRKEAGFEVMDKITLYAKDNTKIIEILDKNGAEIKSAVLATEIVTGITEGYEKSWNVNGEEVVMGVKKN